MLSESTKQLINASGGGTITNLADDEDIESVGQDLKVLKFADRTYNPVAHIGKGYKILRRNIVNGKNILTQEMVNQPHTIDNPGVFRIVFNLLNTLNKSNNILDLYSFGDGDVQGVLFNYTNAIKGFEAYIDKLNKIFL